MRSILVTGGLGFIGSHFIDLLLKEQPEAQVVNLDRLTYAGNPLNLSHLADEPRYSLAKGDVADADLVQELFTRHKFDSVVHFAAESMVDRAIESSAPFIHSNVVGTQVLLDAARKHGVDRYLQVSTDEVYGSLGPVGEFTEQSQIQPNNPYSASKAAGDLLCRSYFVTHGFPVLITRCSNNYGPRQFPEKLIPLMITKALREERLPVFGDGLQVRDWLHVSDHCRALLTVLQHGTPGEVYNIGGGTELPNLELINLLLKQLDKPAGLIEFVPDRPGHDRRYAISHAKLHHELSWDPRVSFAQGLASTIEWYLCNEDWVRAIREGSYQAGYV